MEDPVTLTLASVNSAAAQDVSSRLPHDIRNSLATLSLHLETLERLSGPGGAISGFLMRSKLVSGWPAALNR